MMTEHDKAVGDGHVDTRQRLSGVLGAAMATVLLLALSTQAVAQGGIGALFPGAELEPPEWVVPGTRVTFYAAGTSIANASKQWQKDPNGAWEDPATGERWGQTDTPTPSGEGVFQADVVGVDDTSVGLQWVLYGYDRFEERLFGGLTGGATDPGAAAEEIWVHPELLARLPETDAGELKILRGEYDLEGVTYHAIAVANLDPAAYSSWIYDTDTGLLLSGTTRTQGRAAAVHAEGEDPLPASTQVTLIRFLGVRQRDGAGLGTAPPEWAQPGTSLEFSGSWIFVNPYDPTGPPVVYPAWLGVAFQGGGPSWLEYGAEMLVDFAGVPNLTTATGVAAGGGPYWIDPATLSFAQEGKVIDEDPITGEVVSVEWVGPGPAGEAVTIASQLPGISSRATYDVGTGVLLGVERTEESSGITTQLGLDSLP